MKAGETARECGRDCNVKCVALDELSSTAVKAVNRNPIGSGNKGGRKEGRNETKFLSHA